jgi:hypothetical protein
MGLLALYYYNADYNFNLNLNNCRYNIHIFSISFTDHFIVLLSYDSCFILHVLCIPLKFYVTILYLRIYGI